MAIRALVDHNWTLFLDRDGVINRRLIGAYVRHWGEFEFLPGVPAAIAALGKRFARVIVVTNQQGVYKGLMTETDLSAIHQQMEQELRQAGGRLDAIYACTASDADDPQQCRKPRIGMALQAQRDFPEIQFAKCLMVGDAITDLQFGRQTGMYTAFVSENPLPVSDLHLYDVHIPSLPALLNCL